jgi:hypothetical protein
MGRPRSGMLSNGKGAAVQKKVGERKKEKKQLKREEVKLGFTRAVSIPIHC